jgi:hypothetical protein
MPPRYGDRQLVDPVRNRDSLSEKSSGSSCFDVLPTKGLSQTMTVMSYRAEDNSSRRVIDVAVGILVGLRGCSQREAFEELVRVVNQTGVGLGSVAVGLAALASGASSAGYPEAFAAWGNLVGRGRLASAARPY